MKQQIQVRTSDIPPAEIQRLSRTFLFAAESFYRDPQNLKDFNAWKKQRQTTHKN